MKIIDAMEVFASTNPVAIDKACVAIIDKVIEKLCIEEVGEPYNMAKKSD